MCPMSSPFLSRLATATCAHHIETTGKDWTIDNGSECLQLAHVAVKMRLLNVPPQVLEVERRVSKGYGIAHNAANYC